MLSQMPQKTSKIGGIWDLFSRSYVMRYWCKKIATLLAKTNTIIKQQDISLGRRSKKFCVFVSCLEELNDKCDLSDEASRVFSFLI